MTSQLEKYVEQTFEVECKGRNVYNEEDLREPVKVEVKMYKSPDSNLIDTLVTCQYISGGHGEKCKSGGICAYAITLGKKAN